MISENVQNLDIKPSQNTSQCPHCFHLVDSNSVNTNNTKAFANKGISLEISCTIFVETEIISAVAYESYQSDCPLKIPVCGRKVQTSSKCTHCMFPLQGQNITCIEYNIHLCIQSSEAEAISHHART